MVTNHNENCDNNRDLGHHNYFIDVSLIVEQTKTRTHSPPCEFCCSRSQLTTGMVSSNLESSRARVVRRANPVISTLTEFGTEVHGLPFSKSSSGSDHHFLPFLISAIESRSRKAWIRIAQHLSHDLKWSFFAWRTLGNAWLYTHLDDVGSIPGIIFSIVFFFGHPTLISDLEMIDRNELKKGPIPDLSAGAGPGEAHMWPEPRSAGSPSGRWRPSFQPSS